MNHIKGEQHLIDLNKTFNLICEQFDEFERDRAEREKIINEPLEKVNHIFVTKNSLKCSLDIQEKYSSRNYLLIHRLSELGKENTNELVIYKFREKMAEEIKNDEID